MGGVDGTQIDRSPGPKKTVEIMIFLFTSVSSGQFYKDWKRVENETVWHFFLHFVQIIDCCHFCYCYVFVLLCFFCNDIDICVPIPVPYFIFILLPRSFCHN